MVSPMHHVSRYSVAAEYSVTVGNLTIHHEPKKELWSIGMFESTEKKLNRRLRNSNYFLEIDVKSAENSWEKPSEPQIVDLTIAQLAVDFLHLQELLKSNRLSFPYMDETGYIIGITNGAMAAASRLVGGTVYKDAGETSAVCIPIRNFKSRRSTRYLQSALRRMEKRLGGFTYSRVDFFTRPAHW